MAAKTRVGVYVDSSNIALNGGYGMQYEVLREFACHDAGEIARLNAYMAYDEERADMDTAYRHRTLGFFSALRDIGYKIVEKKVRHYRDDEGNAYMKANADLDLAVDAITQADRLDRVLLVTGDGDFVQVVRALQNKSCRVEILGFHNVSGDLRKEADTFLSGFLVPNLLPPRHSSAPWGERGSRVRGSAYYHHREKNFGFFRFLRRYDSDLHITDTKNPISPYLTAFFHDSHLPEKISPEDLPNKEILFEFDLTDGVREGQLEARNIELIPRHNPAAPMAAPLRTLSRPPVTNGNGGDHAAEEEGGKHPTSNIQPPMGSGGEP